MTTRYQKRHYEDVAQLLKDHTAFAEPAVQDVALAFADLFAADNPLTCSIPDGHKGECNVEGGFDREQFLAACGLESEGNQHDVRERHGPVYRRPSPTVAPQ